jgi:hypothetical protein
MKNIIKVIGIVALLVGFIIPSAVAQKKKADKDTQQWRYEIEAAGVGQQNTVQIKVWSYSTKAEVALEQAKKNAVHGIVFRGFAANDKARVSQKALCSNPNAENEHADFFKSFFADGGKYLKYVQLVNNGAIDAGDRIKIGKEYKIGVVIIVDKDALRKDLEEAGIIKKLGSGF